MESVLKSDYVSCEQIESNLQLIYFIQFYSTGKCVLFIMKYQISHWVLIRISWNQTDWKKRNRDPGTDFNIK